MGNLSGFMSWSASNTSYALAREMDPEPAAVNIPLSHTHPTPVETAAPVPAQLAGPAVSPSSDDTFGPDNPGNQGGRQSSIASTSTSSGSRPDQTQSQSQAQQAKDKDRATVPSACVQCRSKHLKCDGLQPCSRCSSNSFECEYVRSRRGFKGPRRNGTQNKASSVSAGPVDMSCPLVHPNGVRGTPNVPSGLATPPDHRLMTLPRPVDLPLFDIGQEVVAFDPKSLPSGLDLRERCIEAFYYHFYPAHPFTLPRSNHFALRKERPIDYLEAAMRYVGSFYVPQAPTVALGLEAERSVYQAECPKDAFRVQAMLILMPLMHDDDLKQQLRLNTGALKTLWQVWPAAGKAFGQVKGVAQEIYAGKKQAAEVGYWANLTEDEVMRSMIEDQSIMEDLQLLN